MKRSFKLIIFFSIIILGIVSFNLFNKEKQKIVKAQPKKMFNIETIEECILPSTSDEKNDTSKFLGNSKIERQYVNSIHIYSSDNKPTISEEEKTGEFTKLDENFIVWYETENIEKNINETVTTITLYDIYIAPRANTKGIKIKANSNSSYLFAHIGESSECKDAEVIYGLENLDTSDVTNMSYMFYYCGYNSMEKLVLPDEFNISKVENMYGMFARCGYKQAKELNLGNNFNTNNVQNMKRMFYYCGHNKMIKLDLGNKFNISNSTDTTEMFTECGRNSSSSNYCRIIVPEGMYENYYTCKNNITLKENEYRHFAKRPQLESGEEYDVILFWGQSNMTGSCGLRTRSVGNGISYLDYRGTYHDLRYYDENQIEKYYWKKYTYKDPKGEDLNYYFGVKNNSEAIVELDTIEISDKEEISKADFEALKTYQDKNKYYYKENTFYFGVKDSEEVVMLNEKEISKKKEISKEDFEKIETYEDKTKFYYIAKAIYKDINENKFKARTEISEETKSDYVSEPNKYYYVKEEYYSIKEYVNTGKEVKINDINNMILVNKEACSISDFSNKTGIDEEFLRNSIKMNKVTITQTENKALIYDYLQGELVDLNEYNNANINIGHNLVYKDGVLREKLANSIDPINILEASYGTTCIEEYCKKYYELTNRKVVAVFAARGDQSIVNYLPEGDSKYQVLKDIYNIDNNKPTFIYESMIKEYKAAVEYLEKNGCIIGNRISIINQGGSDRELTKRHLYFTDNDINDEQKSVVTLSDDDIRKAASEAGMTANDYKAKLITDNWEVIYTYICKKLKADCNIKTNGIIASRCVDENDYIHKSQENTAGKNSNIFIASRRVHEIGAKNIKETVCYDASAQYDIDDKLYNNYDNKVHSTSSFLSQLGKDSAEATVKLLFPNNPGGKEAINDIEKIQLHADSQLSYRKGDKLSLKIIVKKYDLTEEEINVTPDNMTIKGIDLTEDMIIKNTNTEKEYEIEINYKGQTLKTKIAIVQTYIIKFVNYDGEELQSIEVEYGIMPKYTGDTPTKQASAEYEYKFIGWTPELTAAEKDMTYTATYTTINQAYTRKKIHKSIQEVADAYYRKGIYAQYCKERAKHLDSPEEATSQNTFYSDCSNFTNLVYSQAFGINSVLIGSNDAKMNYAKKYYDPDNELNDVIEYWEKNGNKYGYTDNEGIWHNKQIKDNAGNLIDLNLSTNNQQDVYADIILKNLEIGDIICYKGKSDTHTLLVYDIKYEGNKAIDAIIRDSHSNYETKTTKLGLGLSYEDTDNKNNNVHQGTFQEAYLKENYKISEGKERKSIISEIAKMQQFTILRPLQKDKYGEYTGKYYNHKFDESGKAELVGEKELESYNITDVTSNRLIYSGIDIEKTVNVFNNSVIDLGDELEYTIKITNTSKSDYSKFNVIENISDYVEVVNIGDGKLEENQIIWEQQSGLIAGESKTLTYTVRVKNDSSILGKEIVSTGTVAQIPSSTVKNYISRNLKEQEKTNITGEAENILNSKTYSGAELISKIYENALKVKINIEELDITELINKNDKSRIYVPNNKRIKINTENKFKDMILTNYYGGVFNNKTSYNLYFWERRTVPNVTSRDERQANIYKENLQTGDILVYKNEQISNGTYNTENGTYYLIYISEEYPITVDGEILSGFIGINPDGTINKIFKDESTESTIYDLRTLLGKDYYVILRPSLMLKKIYYELSGGKNNEENPNLYIPKNEFTLKDPTLENNTFKGWYTDPSYENKVTDTSKLSGDITLYAKWETNKHTVTFVNDDGGSIISTKEYDHGTKAENIEIPKTPTKEADKMYTYEFTGWIPEITDVTGDAIYTAVYRAVPKEYTATFILNNGEEDVVKVQNYGSKLEAPTNLSKEGYKFKEWNPEVPSTMPAEDTIYEAVWEEIEKIEVDTEKYPLIKDKETEIEYVTNISAKTNMKEMVEDFVKKGNAEVYRGETKIEYSSEENAEVKIATGDKIKITLNGETAEYIVVVKGDVNGDGEVTVRDIISANALRETGPGEILEKHKLLAADINKTNKIEIRDLISINSLRIME